MSLRRNFRTLRTTHFASHCCLSTSSPSGNHHHRPSVSPQTLRPLVTRTLESYISLRRFCSCWTPLLHSYSTSVRIEQRLLTPCCVWHYPVVNRRERRGDCQTLLLSKFSPLLHCHRQFAILRSSRCSEISYRQCRPTCEHLPGRSHSLHVSTAWT